MTQSPKEMRKKISEGVYTDQTAGLCPGYAQGNLVILPKEYAFDFLLFANRNPKACPILEVVDKGKVLSKTAPGEEITKVWPKYCLYKEGQLIGEYSEVDEFWQDDFVTFVIGCSFTFESALIEAGIPLKHIDQGKNVAMYKTTIPCKSAGIFHGHMVVSMRPIKEKDLLSTVEISAKYPMVHGSPVHIGNPQSIGIEDVTCPDYGEFVSIDQDEHPVFWACGVTPQGMALSIKPRIMITHAPGHMLITDIENKQLSEVKQ